MEERTSNVQFPKVEEIYFGTWINHYQMILKIILSQKYFLKLQLLLGLLLLAFLALIIVLIIKLKLLKTIYMDFSTIFLWFYDICLCG